MPPKAKKTYGRKQCLENIEEKNISDKENICTRLRKRVKKNEDTLKLKLQTSEEEFEKLLLSPKAQEVKLKPLTFWSKKLQELESEKESVKKKKCGLYEFTGTDDSGSPLKKKKKTKKKILTQKKKQQPKFYIQSKSKAKEEHRGSFAREQLMLNKEKEKLAEKDEKFTFSTVMPSLGVTSTPAVNKVNLVGASSFMFLSPVIKEEDADCVDDQYKPNVSQKVVACSESKTPQRKTRLQRTERVLRSGRVIS